MSPLATTFIPEDLVIKKWEDIGPYFEELQKSNPKTLLGLQRLISYYSDVLSVVAENWTMVMIEQGKNSENRRAREQHNALLKIDPHVSRAEHVIETKLVEHPVFRELKEGTLKQVRKALLWSQASFAEANIPLETEIAKTEMRCEEILSQAAVSLDGRELPLQGAEALLESADRHKREEVWHAIYDTHLGLKDQLDAHFNALLHLRHRTGKNAGHRNYRYYEHYGPYPQHTLRQAQKFHRVIEQCVVPLANEITERQKRRLGLQIAYPWDTDASRWGFEGVPKGEEPLHPFQGADDLLSKGMEIVGQLKPEFATNLEQMESNHLLDLEMRRGKYPGGYCTDLEVKGLPYISMHARGTQKELTTFIHEVGHAMHTFGMRRYPLIFYRDPDISMMETGSMGMEFLSMTHWDVCYPDESQHRHAMRSQIEEAVRFLPWCAIIDQFQHWVYQNPQRSVKERDAYFVHLMDRFYPKAISWKGLERYRQNYWQKQAHIFLNPFYYIEYGFASLAAMQLYRNALKNHKETIDAYWKGLRMGSIKHYPHVWKAMGIQYIPPGSPRFAPFVQELMHFAMEQLEELED